MAEKTTKEVNIKLTATDTASAVVAGAKKKIDKELGGLDKLKNTFGEESALGNIGKIATGAGAVGALTLIGSAAAGATAKMVELNNEFKAGRINGAQLAEGIMASLPILGQFWQTGRNIRELITGDEAEAAKRLSIEQAINKAWLERKELSQKIKDLSDPESASDALRREIARKYDADIRRLQDPLKKDFEAGRISASVYSQGLRDNGAGALARNRAKDLQGVIAGEKSEELRSKASKSFVEIFNDATKSRNAYLVQALAAEQKIFQFEVKMRADRLAVARESAEQVAEIRAGIRDSVLREKGLNGQADAIQANREFQKQLLAAQIKAAQEMAGGDIGSLGRLSGMEAALRAQRERALSRARDQEINDRRALRQQSGDNLIGRALGAALGIAGGAAALDLIRNSAVSGTAPGMQFGGTGVGANAAERIRTRQADRSFTEQQKQTKALNELRGTLNDVKDELRKIGVAGA